MARQLRDDDRLAWRAAMRGVEPLQTTRRDSGERSLSPQKRESTAIHGRRESGAPSAPRARARGDEKAVADSRSIDRRTLKSLRRGELAIDARLDLHGLTQQAAHRALARFIGEAAAEGARLALVITGKGRGGEGVLRTAVPRWLNEPALRAHVLALAPAPPNLGGGGALCVRLRRTRAPTRP